MRSGYSGSWEWSTTNWENSYYGGYKKILWDYPTIKIKSTVDWEKSSDVGDLSYYTYDVLCKLFLLRVKDLGIVKHLIQNPIISVEKRRWSETEFTRCIIRRDAVETCVNYLISGEAELGNMFKNYKKLLERTEFYFDLPEKKDSENLDSPDNMDLGNIQKTLEEAFSDIAKWEKSFEIDRLDSSSIAEATFRTCSTARKTKFMDSEKKDAERLLELLDISFQPTPDIVKDLRTGKLDSNKLAQVISGATNVYYTTQEEQNTRPFSVCILADESGSMLRTATIYKDGKLKTDLAWQKELLKTLYMAFSQILPPDKIHIYGHTGDETPIVHIYQDTFNNTFEDTIECMEDGHSHRQNYDGPVIEGVYKKVRSQTDDTILFISISDGEPSGHNYGGTKAIDDMKKIIERCRRDKFVTAGIGLRYGRVKEIYNYHCVIENFEKDMVKKVSALINKVVKTEFQS